MLAALLNDIRDDAGRRRYDSQVDGPVDRFQRAIRRLLLDDVAFRVDRIDRTLETRVEEIAEYDTAHCIGAVTRTKQRDAGWRE